MECPYFTEDRVIRMFNIIICDDEQIFAETISRQIHNIMKAENMEYGITCCKDTVELNDCLKTTKYDLLFLDIRMPSANGLEYAKRLRNVGNNIEIIFVTSNTEYALEAYETFPLTFLKKPIQKEALQKAILKSMELKKDRPSVVFKDKKRGMVAVPHLNIYYAESRYHEVVLCCERREEYTLHESFRNFCNMLPQDTFMQCHRCYIVNLKRVRRIQNYVLVLDNDEEIPISRTLYKEVKERFAQI